jgi:hypothetical protein
MQDAPAIPAQEAAVEASAEQAADLPDHYFELYTLAVEMADRTSARRLTANTFFVTVNTALAAVLGGHAFPWYVASAGIVLSIAWWALLKSYRDINAAKYNVILAMEAQLPARVFGDEWDHLTGAWVRFSLKPGRFSMWLSQYRELGRIERTVPWIFAIIYAIEIVSRAHIRIHL